MSNIAIRLLRKKENNLSGKSYIRYRYEGQFKIKSTPDIDFIDIYFADEAVVQCNILIIKILNQMMMINPQLQIDFDVNASRTVSGTYFFLGIVFSFLRRLIVFNHLIACS